ncbi:MAG: MaoC family dehydratase [Desulfobulbus sp.]|jgi:acyl dehydratase|uniref:MaoC family dehydratase n=1 Tax=Desulfobulbus sp. TaxID=895 RepID=UPI00284DDFB2|nr:MaoC family dehydratase [Desulfobulbus sp.]MDR2549062.1 MaoC family dehydratase [Desulfobulbus sp.]
MPRTFLEDLAIGQKFASGRLQVDGESIKRFAAEFDPQPFHLDEQAAQKTVFRGLAASGWHTAALSMRMLVESDFWSDDGMIGVDIEELHWPHPVRPGDELHIEIEILAIQPSKSKPGQGRVKIRVTTFNQADKVVQMYVANILVLAHRKTP